MRQVIDMIDVFDVQYLAHIYSFIWGATLTLVPSCIGRGSPSVYGYLDS